MFGGLKSFSSDSSGFMLDDLNNVEKCWLGVKLSGFGVTLWLIGLKLSRKCLKMF
jgi:hypothetical protein